MKGLHFSNRQLPQPAEERQHTRLPRKLKSFFMSFRDSDLPRPSRISSKLATLAPDERCNARTSFFSSDCRGWEPSGQKAL